MGLYLSRRVLKDLALDTRVEDEVYRNDKNNMWIEKILEILFRM